MTWIRLVRLLRELAPKTQDHFSLASLNPASTRYRRTKAVAVEAGSQVDQVASVLCEEMGWSPDDMIFLSSSPSGSIGSHPAHFASWLLAQARTKDPEAVVDSFLQFIADNQTPMLEVVPLWGLNPTDDADISNDIKLVSLARIPPSEPKDSLTEIDITLFPSAHHFSKPVRPRAALVREFMHTPIFDPKGGGGPDWITAHTRPSRKASVQSMLTIARSLVLLCDHPVTPIARWYQCDEELPLIGGVAGWGGFELHGRVGEEIAPHALDPDRLAIIQKYVGLPEDVQASLRVPLDRLNTSYVRGLLEDRAIDIGMALESFLCPTKAPEINYRLRLNGTLLLGGDDGVRKRTADIIDVIYELRSNAAHGGLLESGKQKKLKRIGEQAPPERVVREASNLCCELLREIIRRGRIPDWEALAFGWSERDGGSGG